MMNPLDGEHKHSRASAVDLLQQISCSADDIILIIDRDRTILFNCGRRVTSADLSESEEPFACKNVYQLLKDHIETVFDTGEPCSIESALEPDYNVRLHARLTPVGGEQGKTNAVLAIVRDISELKRKEELIASSRKELLQAIDSMPWLFAVVDRNYRISKANRALPNSLASVCRNRSARLVTVLWGRTNRTPYVRLSVPEAGRRRA
jgi:PAS domain-containing protein